MNEVTFEKQYQWQVELERDLGPVTMGLTSGSTYRSDPRRLVFLLSRYKFSAKILSGKSSVLEIGCGDGFGSQLLLQEVKSYVGIDIDPIFIENAKTRFTDIDKRKFDVFNILQSRYKSIIDEKFQSAISLDVLEHIEPASEEVFLKNICSSIEPHGIFVCGMPSLESQTYASGGGAGHINCKTGSDLKKLIDKFFHNTFLFSMNDEVVHTGFEKMAHYIMVVACGLRSK